MLNTKPFHSQRLKTVNIFIKRKHRQGTTTTSGSENWHTFTEKQFCNLIKSFKHVQSSFT